MLPACALAVAGCAVNRPSLSNAELDALAASTRTRMVEDQREVVGKLVRRMRRELDEHAQETARGQQTPPPVFDVLVLSGGGDYGAFGAGVLNGWGAVAGELARPEFDVVTGVSTGALIAPYAFLGDASSYEQILSLYSEPKSDWMALRGLFFFLPNNASFADSKGLRRDLEASLPPTLIQRIAAESEKDRALVIGTTNLDMGVTRGFILGEESEDAAYTGKYDRIYDILMASAAIPGAYPPVVIDGNLYVDGGTTANVLFGTNMRSRESIIGQWRERYPGQPPARVRFWVIVNNQLEIKINRVKPEWPSILSHSVSTAIRASTIASLRNLAAQVDLLRVAGIQAEFRYIAIPEDWRPPVEGNFQPETMRSLAELGQQLGTTETSWRTTLPGESPPTEATAAVSSPR